MNVHIAGSLIKGLHVATSGMVVQNKRLLVLSQNIANASSRASEKGMFPYQRKLIQLETFKDKDGAELVRVKKIRQDKSPFKKVHSPYDPAADETGHVLESNVQPLIEISDMRDAGRSHEAATKAFEKILHMIQNMLGLLKQ